MSLPRGRIEKIVPTEILFSRLADPSSGSIATQSGPPASRISGSSASSDRMAATGTARSAWPHHLVGGNVDILLQIAVGIDPAVPPGNARQRPIGDKVGKAHRRHRERLDHGGNRGTVRRVLHRAIEMRTQRHAFVHGRSPVSALSGAFQNFLPVGSPRRITSQFAKLGKFSYLWLRQSFPYKGWRRWQAGFCEN